MPHPFDVRHYIFLSDINVDPYLFGTKESYDWFMREDKRLFLQALDRYATEIIELSKFNRWANDPENLEEPENQE